MIFPIYSILFAAAVSAVAIPKSSVTVSSATRSATRRVATATATHTQVIQNPSFEIASANTDGYVNQQTPWARSNTDVNDFDMSGLIANSDAPFTTPYGSEFYMFAPTADNNLPSLHQPVSLTAGATYNISYAYNFYAATISQPARASTLSYAATVSVAGALVDTLDFSAANIDQTWRTHSFLYTVPKQVGVLGAQMSLTWGVVADPAKINAGTQFGVDAITITLETVAGVTVQH